MKNLSGKILFLDRSDINTDEIIPAKYLTELYFFLAPKSLQMVIAAMKLKDAYSLGGKL